MWITRNWKSVIYKPLNIHKLKNVIQVSQSNRHNEKYRNSYALTSDGKVYYLKNNGCGKLGNNKKEYTLINNLNDVCCISSGDHFSLFLTNDRKVYSIGCNDYGQLGTGDIKIKYVPTLIFGLSNIISISTYKNYCLTLSDNGKVYSFRRNDYGQLGLGDTNHRNIPTHISHLPCNIIQIATGHFHSAVLTNKGTVYVFGNNFNYRLGLGHDIDQHNPTLVPNLPYITQIAAKKENKCIKRFVCNKHKQKESGGMIMTCDMGNCFKCNNFTTSGVLKYCVGCSASFQICEYCGSK